MELLVNPPVFHKTWTNSNIGKRNKNWKQNCNSYANVYRLQIRTWLVRRRKLLHFNPTLSCVPIVEQCQIHLPAEMQKSGLIYSIPWKNGMKQYTGQTRQTLKGRRINMKTTKTDLNAKTTNNQQEQYNIHWRIKLFLQLHLLHTNHIFDFSSPKIL